MLQRLGIGIAVIMLTSGIAFAQSSNNISLSKKLTPQQKQEILVHNLSVVQSGNHLSATSPTGLLVKRPVAEYEDTGYLMFYDIADFNSADVKAKLIENLPAGVTAVIYTDIDDQKEMEGLYRYYSELAPNPDQVKIINIPNPVIEDPEYGEVLPNGFWARDTIPVPVIQLANISPLQALSERFTVVDAKYYHFYEPDQIIADYYSAALLSHNYYFEGGNFMANAKGDCLVIDTEAAEIVPSHIFTRTYGCSNLIRLPYLKGIGHADESVKFISDNHVLTDDRRYKNILEKEGFKVTMLPRAKRDYETYVNSLIINGTVWVPIYQQKSDATALQVYKDLGFNVIAVDSSILSNDGAGSVHCITMTYPKTTDFNDLLNHFGAKNIVDQASNDRKVLSKVKELKLERQQHLDNLKDPNLDRFLDSLYRGW